MTVPFANLPKKVKKNLQHSTKGHRIRVTPFASSTHHTIGTLNPELSVISLDDSSTSFVKIEREHLENAQEIDDEYVAIKRNVPSEYELMNELIGNLKDGTNTPKKIEAFLKEKFGISDTEASLQRTGIFARMQELGVVKRVKEGRTVIYEVVN